MEDVLIFYYSTNVLLNNSIIANLSYKKTRKILFLIILSFQNS